jgi:hypothetical protein
MASSAKSNDCERRINPAMMRPDSLRKTSSTALQRHASVVGHQFRGSVSANHTRVLLKPLFISKVSRGQPPGWAHPALP